MKLSELTQMLPSLQVLAGTKLPVVASYRVAKAVNLIKPEMVAYDEQREKLLKEFGVINEEGTSYSFTKENGALFSEGMQQLHDEECNITLPTITVDELGDLAIEPHHLIALADIITE